MKKFLIFLFAGIVCILAGTNCNAQTNDDLIDKFRDSFYQAVIKDKPAFTLVRIKVDKMGNIGTTDFSDSADSLFVKGFEIRKAAIDYDALSLYIKRNKIKKTYLLMPLIISYSDRQVASDKISLLTKFKNIDFTGPSIMLKAAHIKTVTIVN